MKTLRLFAIGLIVIGSLISAVNVFAGPRAGTAGQFGDAALSPGLGKPQSTPGAKATQKAAARATEGRGDTDGTPEVESEAEGAGKPQNARENFHGVIASVGQSGFALTLADGNSRAFHVTAGTKINVRGMGSRATLEDIAKGMSAVVRASRGEGGTWTALSIKADIGKPEKVHRVGIVTAYTPGSRLTIQDKKGNTSTFTLTADTKILPAERSAELKLGAWVTVISRRDPKGRVLSAQGIVVHP